MQGNFLIKRKKISRQIPYNLEVAYIYMAEVWIVSHLNALNFKCVILAHRVHALAIGVIYRDFRIIKECD